MVLARQGVTITSWPLAGLRAEGAGTQCPVDLGVIDALARWRLAAQRLGWSIRLEHASPELARLLDLVGLGQVLQVGGQAEGGEQARVDEVVVPDDPLS